MLAKQSRVKPKRVRNAFKTAITCYLFVIDALKTAVSNVLYSRNLTQWFQTRLKRDKIKNLFFLCFIRFLMIFRYFIIWFQIQRPNQKQSDTKRHNKMAKNTVSVNLEANIQTIVPPTRKSFGNMNLKNVASSTFGQ